MAKGRHAKATKAPVKSSSPRMQKAWDLFEEGDKVMARREAKAVLASQPSEAETREATELLERLATPKAAFIFAAVAATTILILILLAVLRYGRA